MEALPVLPGEKVYLGPPLETEGFYREYQSLLNAPCIKSALGQEKDCSLEEIIQLHQDWKKDPQNITFCIYDKKDDELLGDVSLRYNHLEFDGQPEILIMLVKKPGQGKGHEAMKLLLDYGFGYFKNQLVNLSVYQDNLPALRLYKKLGFSLVGERADPSGRKEYLMQLTSETWLNRKEK